MPTSISAGLLMYCAAPELRVLLAHLGGPYFAKKDGGSWSIPKGLVGAGEPLLKAAQREFTEETGYHLDALVNYIALGSIKLKSGKLVHAWAFPGVWESGRVPASNMFEIEWSPRSGRKQLFPEIDRAEMFSIEVARQKINSSQAPLLDRLVQSLDE